MAGDQDAQGCSIRFFVAIQHPALACLDQSMTREMLFSFAPCECGVGQQRLFGALQHALVSYKSTRFEAIQQASNIRNS